MADTPMQALLRAIDSLDIDGALALFAPDGSVTTAFGETASGPVGVRVVLGDLLGGLRATHHDVRSEWNPESGVWIAELEASYELGDYSRRGPYPRVMILRAGDAGIEQLDIYGAHELPLVEEGRPYTEVHAPHGWMPTL